MTYVFPGINSPEHPHRVRNLAIVLTGAVGATVLLAGNLAPRTNAITDDTSPAKNPDVPPVAAATQSPTPEATSTPAATPSATESAVAVPTPEGPAFEGCGIIGAVQKGKSLGGKLPFEITILNAPAGPIEKLPTSPAQLNNLGASQVHLGWTAFGKNGKQLGEDGDLKGGAVRRTAVDTVTVYVHPTPGSLNDKPIAALGAELEFGDTPCDNGLDLRFMFNNGGVEPVLFDPQTGDQVSQAALPRQ